MAVMDVIPDDGNDQRRELEERDFIPPIGQAMPWPIRPRTPDYTLPMPTGAPSTARPLGMPTGDQPTGFSAALNDRAAIATPEAATAMRAFPGATGSDTGPTIRSAGAPAAGSSALPSALPVQPTTPAMPPPSSGFFAGASSAGRPPAMQVPAPPAMQIPPQQKPAIAKLWDRAGEISNPAIRTLARIGTGLLGAGEIAGEAAFPRIAMLVPGSEINTGLRNKAAVQRAKEENEAAMQGYRAGTDRTRAMTEAKQAETASEREARLNKPENPTDKKLDEYTNDQGQRVLTFQRSDGSVYDRVGGKTQEKPERAETPHTVETARGVYQYNPDTNRYDIYVGPPKREAGPEETPAQHLARIRMHNQYGTEKDRQLRQLEHDVRERYGLTKDDATAQWPQEAIDELQEGKQRIQDEYEEKLGTLGEGVTHFDYRSQGGGGRQSRAQGAARTLDRKNSDDRETARQILNEAGGDVNKAREIARKRNLNF